MKTSHSHHLSDKRLLDILSAPASARSRGIFSTALSTDAASTHLLLQSHGCRSVDGITSILTSQAPRTHRPLVIIEITIFHAQLDCPQLCRCTESVAPPQGSDIWAAFHGCRVQSTMRTPRIHQTRFMTHKQLRHTSFGDDLSAIFSSIRIKAKVMVTHGKRSSPLS